MRIPQNELLDQLQRDGYAILDDEELRSRAIDLKWAIRDILLTRARALSVSVEDLDDIDEIYDSLHNLDPKHTGGVYDVIRETPEFLSIINASSVKSLMKSLFGWKGLHIPFGLCQFRIDRPFDQKYHFDWHQDYTYNILSTSAITFWIPLTDVSLEMGAIRVLPGSHNEIHSVEGISSYEPGRGTKAQSHLTFKLHSPDLDKLEGDSISVPVKGGQVLMFHSHVLHRSGRNVSEGRNRWTAIFRIGDLYDQELMDRDFFCARPNKPHTMAGFALVHPDRFFELVTDSA